MLDNLITIYPRYIRVTTTQDPESAYATLLSFSRQACNVIARAYPPNTNPTTDTPIWIDTANTDAYEWVNSKWNLLGKCEAITGGYEGRGWKIFDLNSSTIRQRLQAKLYELNRQYFYGDKRMFAALRCQVYVVPGDTRLSSLSPSMDPCVALVKSSDTSTPNRIYMYGRNDEGNRRWTMLATTAHPDGGIPVLVSGAHIYPYESTDLYFDIKYDGSLPDTVYQTKGDIYFFKSLDTINASSWLYEMFASHYMSYMYSNKDAPSNEIGLVDSTSWIEQYTSRTYRQTQGSAILEKRYPVYREQNGTRTWYKGYGQLNGVTKCAVKETINEAFEAEVSFIEGTVQPIDITEGMLLALKPSQDQGRQLFRVFVIEHDISGIVTLGLTHISYDTSGYFLSKVPTFDLSDSYIDEYDPLGMYPSESYVKLSQDDSVGRIEHGCYFSKNGETVGGDKNFVTVRDPDSNAKYYDVISLDEKYYDGDVFSYARAGIRENYVVSQAGDGKTGSEIIAHLGVNPPYSHKIPLLNPIATDMTMFGVTPATGKVKASKKVGMSLSKSKGKVMYAQIRDHVIRVCQYGFSEQYMKISTSDSDGPNMGDGAIAAWESTDNGNTFAPISLGGNASGFVTCIALFAFNNTFYMLCMDNLKWRTDHTLTTSIVYVHMHASINLYYKRYGQTAWYKNEDVAMPDVEIGGYRVDYGAYFDAPTRIPAELFDTVCSNFAENSVGGGLLFTFQHFLGNGGFPHNEPLETFPYSEYGIHHDWYSLNLFKTGETVLQKLYVDTVSDPNMGIDNLSNYKFTDCAVRLIDTPTQSSTTFPYGQFCMVTSAKISGRQNEVSLFASYVPLFKEPLTSRGFTFLRINYANPSITNFHYRAYNYESLLTTFPKFPINTSLDTEQDCDYMIFSVRDGADTVLLYLFQWLGPSEMHYEYNMRQIAVTSSITHRMPRQMIFTASTDNERVSGNHYNYSIIALTADVTKSFIVPGVHNLLSAGMWNFFFQNAHQFVIPAGSLAGTELVQGMAGSWLHLSLNNWEKTPPPLTHLGQAVLIPGHIGSRIPFLDDYSTPYVVTSDGDTQSGITNRQNLVFSIDYDAGSTPDADPQCTPGAFKIEYPMNLRDILSSKISPVFRRTNDSAPVTKDGEIVVDEIPQHPFEFKFDNNRIHILGAGRGKVTDIVLTYGNMLAKFTTELNVSTCYSAIYPYYWTESEGLHDLSTVGAGYRIVTPEKVRTQKGFYAPRNGIYLLDLTTLTNDAGESLFEAPPATEQEILDAVSRFDSDNGILEPSVSFEIQLDALRNSENAAEYDYLDKLGLGDVLWVDIPKYGFKEEVRIVEVEYDALTGLYSSITLGRASDRIDNTLAGLEQDVKNGDRRAATKYSSTSFVNSKIEKSLSADSVSKATVQGVVQSSVIDGDNQNTVLVGGGRVMSISELLEKVSHIN